MEKNEEMSFKADAGWRPSFSIIVGVGWLIFLIMWFAFYATPYVWEQNFAIILASILAVFILLGGVWAAWGIKRIPKEGKEIMKTMGFKWRVQTSIIIPFVAMTFLIIWFWFYAVPYSFWQNIAVILVTFLIVGGVLGSIWAHGGMKHKWDFEQHAHAAFYHHKKTTDDKVIDVEKKVDEEIDKKD